MKGKQFYKPTRFEKGDIFEKDIIKHPVSLHLIWQSSKITIQTICFIVFNIPTMNILLLNTLDRSDYIITVILI